MRGRARTAEIQLGRLSRIHWKHFKKVGEYKGVKLRASGPRVRPDVHHKSVKSMADPSRTEESAPAAAIAEAT